MTTSLPPLISLIAIPLALCLDRILGEPSKFHPLIGFGYLAYIIESWLNQNKNLFLKGILAWSLIVIPIGLVVTLLDQYLHENFQELLLEDSTSGLLSIIFSAFCGWFAVGWKSLSQHGQDVQVALSNKDLELARKKTSYLVSRDTSKLDETALSRATIESILENGSDAVIAPLFWLAVAGAPGVILYRLINTLDAMWGYHNERYEQFGKFSARIDDAFNYIPARITALLYTLSGNSRSARQAWITQGKIWYSPNAGVVMATGAGALNVKLGGSAVYQGKTKSRPILGHNKDPEHSDIQRSIELLNRSVFIFIVTILLLVFVTTILT